jgi:hypothetical protein
MEKSYTKINNQEYSYLKWFYYLSYKYFTFYLFLIWSLSVELLSNNLT